jgi:phosphoglycolate phosphatase-like HAD superfamily hydrolase
MNNHRSYLPNSCIEIIHPDIQRGKIQSALFDFDGTISLIREGWQSIMIPMMVELLQKTPLSEDEAEIEHVVNEFVTRLTGKQTIYQMIQLCEEIKKRDGTARDPFEYKQLYNDRLNQHIAERIAGLKSGLLNAKEFVVPGSIEWLNIMKEKGITCYLASGTDEKYVLEEVELLGLMPYFSGVYGARDNYRDFSKKMIIDQIIQNHALHGSNFVAFGDGFVEIEDTKSVNGIAVGLATDERNRVGLDEWKRSRLIDAGADVIIPDFREYTMLEAYLFDRKAR